MNMSLTTLRNIMRLLLACLILTLLYWVDFILPDTAQKWAIGLFQVFPLLLVAPLFIKCKSPHLHLALPIIMLYMCFTAPNLYLTGTAQVIALVELTVNIALSCVIMLYLLKASKFERARRQESMTNSEATQ